MNELGICSGCRQPAERGPLGSWWHTAGVDTSICSRGVGDAGPQFVPLKDGDKAAAHRDTWRWCRQCDVKWFGSPLCWVCDGLSPLAYGSAGTYSNDALIARWHGEGGA